MPFTLRIADRLTTRLSLWRKISHIGQNSDVRPNLDHTHRHGCLFTIVEDYSSIIVIIYYTDRLQKN